MAVIVYITNLGSEILIKTIDQIAKDLWQNFWAGLSYELTLILTKKKNSFSGANTTKYLQFKYINTWKKQKNKYNTNKINPLSNNPLNSSYKTLALSLQYIFVQYLLSLPIQKVFV